MRNDIVKKRFGTFQGNMLNPPIFHEHETEKGKIWDINGGNVNVITISRTWT
jgi:hypothetical protein